MPRKQPNPEDERVKRELAAARAEEVRARTTARQGDPYTQQFGFPNLPTMTAAETASERRATNTRLTQAEETRNKVEALKTLHAAAAVTPGGEEHSKAALNELAKMAGVTVPKKAMDPKTAAMNKLRAAKGLPPLEEGGGEVEPGDASGLVARPQQDQQPLFQPVFNGEAGPAPGTTPVIQGNEGTPGFAPHLGIGGAAMTPENPTGNPANPWGAGGLFAGNPTNVAAANVRAREIAVHPFGSDNSPMSRTYFPGEAMDRLAGGGFNPTNLVTPSPPAVAGRNVPPNENVLPAPVNTFQREGNALPPPPQQTLGIGWNTRPGGSLLQDWLASIIAGQNVPQPRRREPVY